MRLFAALWLLAVVACPRANHEKQPEMTNAFPPQERLLIVPFGEVDRGLLEWLAQAVGEEMTLAADVVEPLALPDKAYSPRRGQWLSTALLQSLKEHLRGREVRALGVADVDLFVPELNFVFGEASMDDPVAVISLVRLRQEFYGLPGDDALFRERMLTEAVHELGHTYGLAHCPDPHCVMSFSNSLADTDRKGHHFCPRCRRLLEARQEASRGLSPSP